MSKRPRHGNRQIVVCVIGVDGSGKTTLCDHLAAHLGTEAATRIWLGAEAVLLGLARAAIAPLRSKRAKPGASTLSYREEEAEKRRIADRLSWLKPLYVWIAMADYRLQYLYKIFKARRARILVLDRYIFDVGVNLAVTLGWSEDELVEFLQRRIHSFKFPSVRCLVRVPYEISLQRKDDIPDAEYIKVRMRFYERIARVFGFTILDGTNRITENLMSVAKLIDHARSAVHIHYVHGNNVDVGGADYCLHRLAQEIRLQGFQVTVSLRVRSPILRRYEESAIPVIVAPFCRPQLSQGTAKLLIFPFEAVWSLIYFWRLFRVLNPQIVHVNDLIDFIPALAAWLCRIPAVYHLRMIRQGRIERRAYGRLVAKLGAASISVSEAVRRTYFGTQTGACHQAEVIHDWPNEALTADQSGPCPVEYKRYPIRVVMVGRIERWKGQHVFVEAVTGLRKTYEEVGFFLIGGTVAGAEKEAYSRELLAAAERAGVGYLGERSDVADLLRWAHITVHASILPDPFPGVVLESLLSSTATIAADAGGVPEIISSGSHGLLYPPGDADSLRNAIDALLSDPERRRALAGAGRLRVLELTNKATLVGRFASLYRDVLSGTAVAKELVHAV